MTRLNSRNSFIREALAAARLAVVALFAAGCTSSPDNPPPPPPVPTISISDATIIEGDSGSATITFDLQMNAASSDTVSVDFATANGSAAAGSDFVQTVGTINIGPGLVSGFVLVDIVGDTLFESDETFTVDLSNPVNATIADASATGTIQNDDAQPLFGLDARPQNVTCVAPARPQPTTNILVEDAFPGLTISQPTKMLMEPVPGNPRWFVLRKTGELMVFDPADAVASLDTYLNLSGQVRTNSEGGLLGMAFHPNYPATPEIFLSYTRQHSGPSMMSVISRFTLDDVADPDIGTIEEVIIEIEQDFDNHNGGDIDFGADGMLYIGLGDGGSGGDPNNRAQDTRHMLGSMLRIDVLSASPNPYEIPPGNPFFGNAKCGTGLNANDCPEIYAWGLRNPWRWSFDPVTDQLWAADVGQNAWEEVDLIELGNNYGWRCREGAHDFNTAGCGGGYTEPVVEYSHSQGNSITGGYVYRGSAIPALVGAYIYADYGSGRIWATTPDGMGGYATEELADTSHGPTAFGVDENGELYYTDINNSRLRRIVPDTGGGGGTIPDLLSNSGCVDPNDITQPYAGLIPYDVNAYFWSDGAVKDRQIGIPDGATISIDANDDWVIPNGTIIVKNYRLNGDLIETRHLMRHPDGVWAGYTYEWNPTQTEATLVVGGKTENIDGQDWVFPSGAQCDQCHTSVAGFSLGLETAQMNRDFTYPSTGRTSNQLLTLDHIMAFTSPLPGSPDTLPELADPNDLTADLDDRARAYLHTNCAQCHRANGPTPVDIDLQYDTPVNLTQSCDVVPTAGDLGLPNARIIAPGSASSSVLVERMNRRDVEGMPPVASTMVDGGGVTLITDWINSLANCN